MFSRVGIRRNGFVSFLMISLVLICLAVCGTTVFAADDESLDEYDFDKAVFAEKLGLNMSSDGHVAFVVPDKTDLGGDYVLDCSLSVTDDNAYSRIQCVSADMVSLTQTFEGGLVEVDAMLTRMQEIVKRAVNDTETAADVEAELRGIQQLFDEMLRIRDCTYFNDCYGLAGVSVSADLPGYLTGRGTVLDFELQDSYDIFAQLSMLPDLLLDRTDDSSIRALTLVETVSSQVQRMRAVLGSVQNSASHLSDFGENCQDLLDSYGHVSGNISVRGNVNDRVGDTDPDYIITSSSDNVFDAITYCQLNEGSLNEMHDIMQRMNEMWCQYSNELPADGSYSLETEYSRLREVVTYMANVTSWEGHHGLNQTVGSMTFPCGWADLCHHEIVLNNVDITADGLGLPSVLSIDTSCQDAILESINAVSLHRSYLGSWQNGCEHILSLCDRVLEKGPMIGNKFGYDEETGHHTLDVITGEFEMEIGHINNRIIELTDRIVNDETYSDMDRAFMQSEIDVLYITQDLLVDLLQTRTSNITHVSKDSENWDLSAEITDNQETYFYRLTYFSNLSPTTDVCIVDYIEDGDNSSFAGTLTGIDLSEVDLLGIPVQVFAILYDGPVSRSRAVLPDILPEGEWVEIDPGTFGEWSNVQALAFYFGDTVFGPEQGMSNTLGVTLNMIYDEGGKPGSEVVEMPQDGYCLQNTCYTRERTGDSDEIQQHMAVSSTLVRLSEAPVGTGTLRISKKVNWIERDGLTLTKTVDKDRVIPVKNNDDLPYNELTYTITVSNPGDVFRANNVVVMDLLPQGVVFKSAMWEPNEGSSLEGLVWDTEPVDGKYELGCFLPHDSGTLTIVGIVDGMFEDGDFVRNTAFVTNDDVPVPEPVHVDTTVVCPDSNGDGIPDYLQYEVRFSVVNGTIVGGFHDLTVFVTKLDSDGNPSNTGTARLLVQDIPSFTADAGYTGGHWSTDVPVEGHIVVRDEHYVFTYEPVPPPDVPDPDEPDLPPTPG